MLAGEDSNDRQCLRHFLVKLSPRFHGRLVEIKDPVRLREATDGNLNDRVETIVRKAQARAVREESELGCLIVCEDFDRPDGQKAHIAQRRVQQALRRFLKHSHYILAVAELEAWLLRFPDALAEFCATWRVPQKYYGCDTECLPNPKEILRKQVSCANRRYHEGDAPQIAELIVNGDHLHGPIGRNESWNHLLNEVAHCEQQHLT